MITDRELKTDTIKVTSNLFQDISSYIETARTKVANYTNASLVMLYWQIVQRINKTILNENRAAYGEGVIKQLAQQLSAVYGLGFEVRSLFRMVQFATFCPDKAIVSALSTLLSWSHFIERPCQ